MKHLIVGLGSIGRHHAQNLLSAGEQVEGVDIPGAPAPDGLDIPVYDSLVLGWKAKPDMVWICTPTRLHAAQAVEAISRGFHVFIEKPLAHDLESARAIEKAWGKTKVNRLIWVGCNMRFHPGVIRIKEAVDQGLIGKPLIYRIHFSHYLPNMRLGKDYRSTYAAHADQGGGIILDDIHDIDLALWLAGPVKKIVGVAVNTGALDVDVEDVAHISFLHRNGVFSEVHMDYLRQDKSRGIEIIGEKGTLEWRSRGKNPEQAALHFYPSGQREARQLWQEEIADFRGMFSQQLNTILGSFKEPGAGKTRLQEAIEALQIAQQVKESYLCQI